MARRRIPPAQGNTAVNTWLDSTGPSGQPVSRAVVATAVRFLLEELAEQAPGNSVEVRVPPFGVTQCVEGPRHTRGTPANVVELDAETWLGLATGLRTWDEAINSNSTLRASGVRAQLGHLLPLFPAT